MLKVYRKTLISKIFRTVSCWNNTSLVSFVLFVRNHTRENTKKRERKNRGIGELIYSRLHDASRISLGLSMRLTFGALRWPTEIWAFTSRTFSRPVRSREVEELDFSHRDGARTKLKLALTMDAHCAFAEYSCATVKGYWTPASLNLEWAT